jgi:protein gp37
MAANSAIEWTDHTFNAWRGCTKVHAGCTNCYAEVNYSVKMHGVKWGPNGTRVKLQPRRVERAAEMEPRS